MIEILLHVFYLLVRLNISFLNLHLITKVKFITSSISNGLLFWVVNHTLISSNSELNVFDKYYLLEKILINYQTFYLEETYTRLLKTGVKSSIFNIHYIISTISIFNFKCNPVFYFIYIYLYWWFISVLSMLFENVFKVILNIWYRVQSIR